VTCPAKTLSLLAYPTLLGFRKSHGLAFGTASRNGDANTSVIANVQEIPARPRMPDKNEGRVGWEGREG
jgi:hypothetical protein